MRWSRREFGKLTLAGLPAAFLPLSALAKIDSRIKGVQIGAITYSFRAIPNAGDIVKAYVTIGLGEMELMSNHAEALAGAPGGRPSTLRPFENLRVAPSSVEGREPQGRPEQGRGTTGSGQVARGPGQGGRGRGSLTPEEQAARDAAAKALHDWRMSASQATFTPVRRKIEDAGIDLRLLCYNMNVRNTTDDEIEYAFMMARWLGVKAISTSTQVSMAKRLAPFADKHKMLVGFHGHANTTDPDEVATPASFAAVMAASKYHGANLDIGHYTEAGYDPVAFIAQHHARTTNLHLKDKKKATNGGGNTPWGQGDTPIKDVLKLLQKNKWDLPANVEFEYAGDPLVEMPKCLQYCKDALA